MSRILLSLLLCVTALAQTKLLRFPDIHKDKVVFSYGGDLWLASTSGGLARRLTAHPGLELFARFSPDGNSIAFTGQYDGDEQVYVIPAEGGVPRQLTWYPATGPLTQRWGWDHQVLGWTPDGKSVLFRSFRDNWTISESRIYTVAAAGGLPVALPLPRSGAADYSPDGRKLVYSPLARDFRSEKRYAGGTSPDLYIFDLPTAEQLQITNHARADRDPMWIGDKIYYTSDHDGTFNLYAYDNASRQTRQLTASRKWDVRWPSADAGGQIVYELDGELQIFDARSGKDRKLSINVPGDGLNTRPSLIPVAGNIENFGLSPKGERAVFIARGDVFTAPIEKGVTRNLTNSSTSHEKWASWSPDGRKIAFMSDMSGEDELYLIDQDGSGKPERLTTDGKMFRYQPSWSGDSKRIAFSDRDGRLWVLTLEDKKLTEAARDKRGQIRNYVWSADGGFLAFTMPEASGFGVLHIWSAADNQTRAVTSPFFNVTSPSWDPEGNYLFYLSDREFAPQLSTFEFNFATSRTTGIFALALRKDVKNLFPPESDEVSVEKPKEETKKEEPKKDEAKKDDKPATPPQKSYMKIDFDGLAARSIRVPVEADNIGGVIAVKGHLLYGKASPGFYGRAPENPTVMKIYSLKDRKDAVFAERVSGAAISQDGSKVLLRLGPEFRLLDVRMPAGPPSGPPGKAVSTAGLKVDRVPEQEWAQIFDEVWRRFRDFFYVPNMHGNDWNALREQYRPMLKHVAHRADLNYVIHEMISELAVSHAYIAGGDWQAPPRPPVALPGARFALDEASGRFRIARIFPGQNEEERYRSPLTEVGVNVKEGDYVLAIEGQELKAGDNPYRLLKNKADRPVALTVSDKPLMEGSRIVTFRPITSEQSLLYLEMVERNRQQVEKLSNGRAGYIHVPDMGADGIREFIKQYYSQIRKEALVVDVRYNGGGNVSQLLIERLRRSLLGVSWRRGAEEPGTYPGTVFHGAMVCLLNENSSSDGDIFPNMFRKAGLGPLIGKRSWGGVVGITDRGPLLDGGTVNVPEFASADPTGKWEVEGVGVTPDIEVENDPASVLRGQDKQLERGVEEVLKRLQQSPRKLPARPPDPVRTK